MEVLEELEPAVAVRRLEHGDLGVVAVQADGGVGPLPADRVTAKDGQPEIGEEGDRRLEVADGDADVLQRDGHGLCSRCLVLLVAWTVRSLPHAMDGRSNTCSNRGMRWDSLRLTDDEQVAPPAGRVPLLPRGAVTRTFDTPEFRGITFHEVTARSALNQVPEASRMPFRWTVNPYRGCSHACVYCFARRTHEYLDLDSGHDFDSQIVVKTNVGEVLRRELARPSWSGEHVAMGTNVDCYQRAEGRYQLMPDILRALIEVANPFSILTKGALVLRDLPLLEAAADVADVSAAVSVGFLDEQVWRRVEPGTPPPARRLEVCARLNAAGIPTGVLMAPILPFLTDSDEQLERTVAAAAAAGAQYLSPIVLHLRPGAREWWQAWLRRERPDLLPAYAALYGERSYAPSSFTRDISERVRALAERHGIGRSQVVWRRSGHERARANRPRPLHAPPPVEPEQLSLL